MSDDSGQVHSNGKRRILVVDEEPAVLRLVQRVFRDDGFEIVCALDPETALLASRISRFDLVLASAYRRRPDGNDPLAELQRSFPELPILTLEELDGDDRLGRFSVERLIAAVQRALNGGNHS